VTGEGGTPQTGLQLAVFAGDDVSMFTVAPGRGVSIGRAEGNDVRIDHPSVSRKHAVLHLDEPMRIEDLNSQNGTFVRDPSKRSQTGDTQDMRQLSGRTLPVRVGDCINVGSVTMVLRHLPRALSMAPGDDEPAASEPHFVVRDPGMRALYEQAARIAQSNISVLVLGETGVGKEVLAETIHQRSPRASKPFLAVNCAALPESLIESELFGYEKGAHSTAFSARPGLFESANGGTVFLDEIGELPLGFQPKLLRVLDDRKVMRVGGRTPIQLDVRFVSATNRDLEAEVARNAFRADLLHRLNGISFTIPPLRNRLGEIESLARAFVAQACRQMNRRDVPALSPEVVVLLQRYHWPGNVRELVKAMDRAVVMCTGDTIMPEQLSAKMTSPSRPMAAVLPPEPAPANAPASVRPAAPGAAHGAETELAALEAKRRELDKARIVDALQKCAGHQGRAAKMLGISLRTLQTRLDEYDIPRPRKQLRNDEEPEPSH
jgi:DNA-binding NtrC family response regulator